MKLGACVAIARSALALAQLYLKHGGHEERVCLWQALQEAGATPEEPRVVVGVDDTARLTVQMKGTCRGILTLSVERLRDI